MFSSFSSPFVSSPVHQIFSSFTSSVFLPFSKKSKDKAEFEKFTFCCYTCLSLNLKDVSEKLITHGFLHPFLLTPLWGPVQLLTPWVGGVRVERLLLFVLADRHQPASHQVAPPGVHLEQAVKKDWVGLNRAKKSNLFSGWQNLAAFRWGQKLSWKFSSSAYLKFSRQMRHFCA